MRGPFGIFRDFGKFHVDGETFLAVLGGKVHFGGEKPAGKGHALLVAEGDGGVLSCGIEQSCAFGQCLFCVGERLDGERAAEVHEEFDCLAALRGNDALGAGAGIEALRHVKLAPEEAFYQMEVDVEFAQKRVVAQFCAHVVLFEAVDNRHRVGVDFEPDDLDAEFRECDLHRLAALHFQRAVGRNGVAAAREIGLQLSRHGFCRYLLLVHLADKGGVGSHDAAAFCGGGRCAACFCDGFGGFAASQHDAGQQRKA